MQHKQFILFLFLAFAFSVTLTANIDSLKFELKNTKGEKEKANLYFSLAEATLKSDFKLSANYADSVIALAKSYGDLKFVAKAIMLRGNSKFYGGFIDDALTDYNQVEPIFSEQKMLNDLAKVYVLIGQAFDVKRKQDLAELNYGKAIELAVQINNDTVIAKANISIGILKYTQRKYYESTLYYKKGISKAKLLNDMRMYAIGSGNLANVYRDFGEIELAKEIHLEMIEYAKANNDLLSLSANYHNLAGVYSTAQDTINTLKYLHLAADLKEQIQDIKGLISTYNNLIYSYYTQNKIDTAKIYCDRAMQYLESFKLSRTEKLFGNIALVFIKLNKIDSAKYFIAKQEELDTRNGKFGIWADAIESKADLAIKEKRFEDAVLYYDLQLKNLQYIQANSSIVRSNFFKEKMEYESIQNELSYIKEKDKFKSYINYMLLAIIILITGATFYMYVSIKKIKKINNTVTVQSDLLQDKNIKLNELLNEKESIMSIVAHDLRNPIHQINSLIHLIDHNDNPESKEIVEMMEKACNNGLNLIEDLLIINTPYNKLDLVAFDPKKWIIGEVQKFEQMAKKKNIKLHLAVNFDDFELNTDSKLLTRITDNLLSNAIKFTHEFANVYVTVDKNDAALKVSIKDEGQGIDPKEHHLLFQKYARISSKPTGNESSTGLGLAIVQKLTEQLNGTVNVTSEIGVGSTFILEIPSLKA